MTPQFAQIAHYRIVSKLGEGGMGAVYRATDTKLNRDVAIKILPDAFASAPDRLVRFTREAQVLASLNHPNIAAIYGVEDRAIVMELVEGATVAGPMPVEEVRPLIEQFIDALEYAHEKGIVHRDLKPANLKLTPDRRLKVLDFGLAKALSSEPAPTGNLASSPTMTMQGTMAGVIMGTAAYMSPEQARGHNVDKRADIWSFGVVVYELLTGRQLFHGGTVSDTLAAVLRQDLDLDAVPRRFRKLLSLCLTRDPLKRLRDISGARLLLEEEPAPLPTASRTPTGWIAATLGLAVLAAIALGVAWHATRPTPPQPLVRLDVLFDPEVPLARSQNAGMLALSPDGSRIAVTLRTKEGRPLLGVRALDQRRTTPLPGTKDAAAPFFSPDGQWIGFSVGNMLKKVSVNGGAPVSIGEASSIRGAYWAPDGVIYVAGRNSTSSIFRLSESGGMPAPVTKLGLNAGSHRWPELLPGGQALLFTSSSNTTVGNYDEADVDVFLFKTGEQKTLVHGGFSARFLPVTADAGYLLYMQRSTLLAAPFDVKRLALTGAAVPMLTDVDSTSRGGGDFHVSRTGTLVFHEGHTGTDWPLLWLEAAGKTTPLRATPAGYYDPLLSPDGRRLACVIGNGHGSDIWVDDLDRDSISRLTSMAGLNQPPVWSPDGKGIFFRSGTTGNPGVYWVPADGSGEPLRLSGSKSVSLYPSSMSPDGKVLALGDARDIFTAAIEWDGSGRPRMGEPVSFVSTAFSATAPALSPDGRWLAYQSIETGVSEIYVRPFPGRGGKVQVSNGGGSFATWSRAAHELYFRDAGQRLAVVDYSTDGGSFRAGKPRVWSQTRVMNLSNLRTFDLAPDGKRMAIIPASAPGEQETQSLTVLLNFTDELRRRIPEGK